MFTEYQVMISANAVNGVKAESGSSYLAQAIADHSARLREESGLAASSVSMAHYDVAPRHLYNTNLDYKFFMTPGLMAMLLILLAGFLHALNIVGEKEKGAVEQINTTPVDKFDLILSKLTPYWVVGLLVAAKSVSHICTELFLVASTHGQLLARVERDAIFVHHRDVAQADDIRLVYAHETF